MRLLSLLLFAALLVAGCETVQDSARRSAERAAERATDRAVEGAIDGAADRAAGAVGGRAASGRAPDGRGTADGAAAGPAPDCQALLPDAEVARVCRRRSVEGDAVNERAAECSRAYAVPGGDAEAGLVLMVNAEGPAAGARMAVQAEAAMAMGGPSRTLPDLGDGGVARTLNAPTGMATSYTEHGVTFSSGATMVQLKATQMSTDRPAVCTLDQMVTLARGIAGRLGR